jgi:hypothetical protein
MAVTWSVYCSPAAPPGTPSPLIGTVASFDYSFGHRLDTFVGVILVSRYGSRMPLQMFEKATGTAEMVYLTMNRLWLVKLGRLRTRPKSVHVTVVSATGAFGTTFQF